MANIMINNLCNLRCPYCFVNDFGYNPMDNMTIENFNKAVEFITKNNSKERIGVIGGEPTLHPLFKNIIMSLIKNEKVDEIVVFSNGIYIHKFWNELTDSKIKLLINCNSQKIISEVQYSQMRRNIFEAVHMYKMGERIALGINIYDRKMDYEYLFDILKENNIKSLRLSIVVPNFETDNIFNVLDNYRSMKEIVYNIICKALKNSVMPHFDCNIMPLCIFSRQEKEYILSLAKGKISNVVSLEANCSPVIDILQDLTAVRCFGISQRLKVPLSIFDNIEDLRNYFKYRIDDYSYIIKSDKKCEKCYERITKKCHGSCLVYKVKQIEKCFEESGNK